MSNASDGLDDHAPARVETHPGETVPPEDVTARSTPDDLRRGLREPADPTTPAEAGKFVFVAGFHTFTDGMHAIVNYDLSLRRNGPGDVDLLLHLNDKRCAHLPWNNIVKAHMRLDPEHAAGPEREIAGLYQQLATERGAKVDLQVALARAREQEAQTSAVLDGFVGDCEKLKAKVAILEGRLAAYTRSSIVPEQDP